jgi:hypothetical protein
VKSSAKRHSWICIFKWLTRSHRKSFFMSYMDLNFCFVFNFFWKRENLLINERGF